MRGILIVVLVVALAIMVVGMANLDRHADIGYLFGTWHSAALPAVFAIVAGVVVAVGVVAAGFASAHARDDRRKLEAELQKIYVRLRAAEAALSSPAEATSGGDTGAAEPASAAAGRSLETPVADDRSGDPAVG